jgi:hypothetical protein
MAMKSGCGGAHGRTGGRSNRPTCRPPILRVESFGIPLRLLGTLEVFSYSGWLIAHRPTGLTVASRIDALLKLSVIAGVLGASSSVAYYYVMYSPRRDAQLNIERAWERARADAERRAEWERALSEQRASEQRASEQRASEQRASEQRASEQRASEQRASEQGASDERQATENATAQMRYQVCLSSAQRKYAAAWTESCKRLGIKDRAECLAESYGSKELCDTMQRDRDVTPNCFLPRSVGTEIKSQLANARERCQQE